MLFNPPTAAMQSKQAPMQAQHDQLLLSILSQNDSWSEGELAKASALAISHVRQTLNSLMEQGKVRRLGSGMRAFYGLAQSGLPSVHVDLQQDLSDAAQTVLNYLQGRSDSISNISQKVRLPREEVSVALATLEAHGLISCSFVGMLAIFRTTHHKIA